VSILYYDYSGSGRPMRQVTLSAMQELANKILQMSKLKQQKLGGCFKNLLLSKRGFFHCWLCILSIFIRSVRTAARAQAFQQGHLTSHTLM